MTNNSGTAERADRGITVTGVAVFDAAAKPIAASQNGVGTYRPGL
jgi:hypothetical protein